MLITITPQSSYKVSKSAYCNKWQTDFKTWRQQEIKTQFLYSASLTLVGIYSLLKHYQFKEKYFWSILGGALTSGVFFIVFLKPLRAKSIWLHNKTEDLVEFIDEYLTFKQVTAAIKQYFTDLDNWKKCGIIVTSYLPFCLQTRFPPLRLELILAAASILIAIQPLLLSYLTQVKGSHILSTFFKDIKIEDINIFEAKLNEILENPQTIKLEANRYVNEICNAQLDFFKETEGYALLLTNEKIFSLQQQFKKHFEQFYKTFKFPNTKKTVIISYLLESINLSRKQNYTQFCESKAKKNEKLIPTLESFIEKDFQNIFKIWITKVKPYRKPASLPLPVSLYATIPYALVCLGTIDLYSIIFLITITPIKFYQINTWRVLGVTLTFVPIIFSINDLWQQVVHISRHPSLKKELTALESQSFSSNSTIIQVAPPDQLYDINIINYYANEPVISELIN